MSKVLCVDTSSKMNGVAVFDGDRIISSVLFVDNQSCLVNLTPAIELALASSKTDLSDLMAVAIVIGPGAWSSLRIGVAAIKQLCLVRRIPLVPISSLDVIAQIVAPRAEHILSVIDANHQRAYAATYRSDGKAIVRLTPYRWSAVEEIANAISDEVDDLLIAGDGAYHFEKYLKPGWQTDPAVFMSNGQQIETVGKMALSVDPVFDLEAILKLKPLYIQPSSAEVEFGILVTQEPAE
jgi:tRNA threonylcarbamoyladenosine biosynthesis protein TsaB